ncbi:MAG: HD domain-containing protein [Candidatus Hydrogenedentes bacterium]|nr:HD domain-containing protein [Candidatus Hydrogenedentota bacterium]
MHYSDRYRDALLYAFDAHRTQIRKGSDIPYITHLLSVAASVGEYGGTEDQAIAALLHDAAEDQGGAATVEDIRARFGDAVATCVAACSDTFEDPKPAWRPRKEKHVAKLREVPPEIKLVVAADKLHNARSMLRDYRMVGPALWERFTADRDSMIWYLRSMHGALSDGWEHPILLELADVLEQLEAAST